MIFNHPIALLTLWLLPVLAGLLVHAQRRRNIAARRFADPAMVQRLMPARSGARLWWKGGLLVLGIGLLLFAASGPRFGKYFVEVKARGVDLFVVLDVSRSMLARDVAPSRLERAKSDVRDLLAKLAGHRVGLIAFAGTAVVKVPLTTDHGFFREMLAGIDTDSAPRGGSLIGDAIRKALQSLGTRRDRDQVLVVITDGEDHDSFPDEAAKLALEQGVKIFTVGMGDDVEGQRIPLQDENGNRSYLKHEGQEVWSRMDEDLLKRIALTTGGAYIPAKTRAYDLGQVYEDHLSKLTMGDIHAAREERYRQRFQWFAACGLGLVLLEMIVARYPRSQQRVELAR